MARKKKQAAVDTSWIRRFDSPIEVQMRNALVRFAMHGDKSVCVNDYSLSKKPARALVSDGRYWMVGDHDDWGIPEGQLLYGDREADEMFSLYSSVWLSSYRLDFLLETGLVAIDIECDGHEFHGTTKQQASADRARDRELLRLGIVTVRFTGSDIFRDAAACAREAFDIAMILKERHEEAVESGSIDGWRAGSDRGFREGVRVAHFATSRIGGAPSIIPPLAGVLLGSE